MSFMYGCVVYIIFNKVLFELIISPKIQIIDRKKTETNGQQLKTVAKQLLQYK